jgi:hypothetical protein
MNNEEDIMGNVSLLVKEKSELSNLYNELNNAINSSNIQSIWALSKVITKYHFNSSAD